MGGIFGKDKELAKEAVAGARTLTHRQADAEAALRQGMGFPLADYWQLDLAVTPGFCAAAAEFLRRNAATHPAADPEATYRSVEGYFSPYLGGIEWLTAKSCDIDDAVTRIEATIGAYKETPSRDAFLAVLAWRRGNGFVKRDDNDRALGLYDTALRLAPDNAQFFNSRGDLFFAKAQYDRAIADYDEAIRHNAGYTTALNNRGNAYHEKGDDERAQRDYDEAITRNPEFALAYNNRANLLARQGQLDRAMADYDEALRLAPKFRLAMANRGRVRFYLATYGPAAADLAAALSLKADDAYTVLWLYLARSRAGQPATDALRADAAALDRNSWPWPVVAAFLGEKDMASLLSAARTGDEESQKGQQCEADFYLGAKAASEGDRSAASDLLRQAHAICPASFIETAAARFELARLQ